MDYTESIKEISKKVIEELEKHNGKIDILDWVLAKVKAEICANTPIKFNY